MFKNINLIFENTKRPLTITAGIGFLVFLIVFLIEVASLKLWKVDLSVPFNYWGDTLWFFIPIKGIVENGWSYNIPQLSAPFGLRAVAFPSITNIDWMVMKGLSVFLNDAGRVLNIFWLFSILLTAWSAIFSLRFLGVRTWLAIAVAIIYAFLPSALLRNVAHISLSYYCVPLLVLVAIHFASGCNILYTRLALWVGCLAVVFQGFNYIYFSFFTVFLFIFSGFLGLIQSKSWRPLRQAVIASLLLGLIASLNLAPSFLSWYEYGKPPNMDYKSANEAEIYGLKIRKMLAPNEANTIPLLSVWGRSDQDSKFPIENENTSARLGNLAAVGLIMLLMVSAGLTKEILVPEYKKIKIIASLTLASLLLSTVGGFGAIFNQIIPDIRAYNRFSVFIAFLSLAGIALWWQAQMRVCTKSYVKVMLLTGFVFLWGLSFYDQILDTAHLNNRRPSDEASATHEREFVREIEKKFPLGTSVFQLPITGFPTDRGVEKMLPYDHARPYLWSSKLNWSWPSFSLQHNRWLSQSDGLTGVDLVEFLIYSNFRLVWIDRFGYSDNGEKVISGLIAAGATNLLLGASSRYVALDLSAAIWHIKNRLGLDVFRQRQEITLNAPVIDWKRGIYTLEHNSDGRNFRWSQAESSLEIHYYGKGVWNGNLVFHVASSRTGYLVVSVGGKIASTIPVVSVPTQVRLPLALLPSSKTDVKFSGDMGRIDLPTGETRDLHFYLMDVYLKPTF